MLQKTVGIVLHTLKYNDTSNIVDIYTRENGRASFLVSVPRSRKSAVKTVLFQPLSMIEFEADYRPMSNLYRIKEAKSWHPSARCHTILINLPLPCSWRNFCIVLCVKKRRTGRCLLIWSILSGGWTNATEVFPIFIWFSDAFSRFLGLYPNTEDYREGCFLIC